MHPNAFHDLILFFLLSDGHVWNQFGSIKGKFLKLIQAKLFCFENIETWDHNILYQTCARNNKSERRYSSCQEKSTTKYNWYMFSRYFITLTFHILKKWTGRMAHCDQAFNHNATGVISSTCFSIGFLAPHNMIKSIAGNIILQYCQ